MRSIEDQIAELRAFAKQENLEIVEELIEKQSAKIPGRPIFNSMMERIEKGEANAILSWHPDRLARNSVDGGKIIYLLDTERLAGLRFPTFWFEPTPQGKFMLNIAFGQSKYYVDSLSENTKRGMRQKAMRGEYPGLAPVGYINDVRSKSIVLDKKKSVVIRRAFELYAQNNSRLEDISSFLAQHGITTSGGKPLKRDRISRILSNPFYIGLFRYSKELHEGKHEPAISKKIFDKVQEVLKQRGKPQKTTNEPRVFCGLLKCGTCQMMITAELQKGHVYYRCTRKSKVIKCSEPYIREEALDTQLSSLLEKFSLREDWAAQLLQMLNNEKTKSARSSSVFVQEMSGKIKDITIKLQRLLDGYLDQVIEQNIYRREKAKLLSEKKTLEEQITKLEQKRTGWLEPMQDWITKAQNIEKIARESNLGLKKVAAKEIFGSNLLLSKKELALVSVNCLEKSGQTQWAALRAAHDLASKKSFSFLMVPRGRVELP